MTNSMTVAGVALTSLVLFSGPAFAQSAQQTIEVPAVAAVEAVPAVKAIDAVEAVPAVKAVPEVKAVTAVKAVPAVEGIDAVPAHQASAGYRASKVIGSSVLNDAGESIGEIDDIIVSSDGNEPYAVISVGGFLGMGARLIVVRYDNLKLTDNKVVLAGGTKYRLEAMPEFAYAVE